MFSASVKVEDKSKRISAVVEKAAFRNFGHAAASISKDVKSTLVNSDGPSAPGEPPHTHQGAHLRRAIRFDATKTDAVIGPQASIVGEAGAAHELGEEFRGQDYPERPFMGPGLERGMPRFASDWAGSIGE
jgi:hypothetical protein